MSAILIFSENKSMSAQLLTAASELKAKMNLPITALALKDADAEALAAGGADKVTVLKNASGRAEGFVPAILKYVKAENPSVFLIGGTPRGKDIAAKIAASIDAGLVTEAQKVSFSGDAVETERMIYGGLAVCTEAVSLPAVVTVAARAYEECSQLCHQGEVVSVDAEVEAGVSVKETSPIVRDGVDITEAEKLVSVGRGLSKLEDMTMVKELAGLLNAEVACSRSIAEDYHWLPVESYVGISGQKVKPALYFTLGISGQIQHVAGMRESKVIVAVDMNEKAPIFEAADYGIVGDIYEVVPALIAALKK